MPILFYSFGKDMQTLKDNARECVQLANKSKREGVPRENTWRAILAPAFVFSLALILQLRAVAQVSPKPLSKDEIVRLLKGDVTPRRVAELARERSIDFQITMEIEKELRAAGADDALLSVLRGVAPKPAPPAAPKPSVERAAEPSPGAVKENPKDGLKYVWIPPGAFMMGCSPGDSECNADEKPAHPVTITKGFWMGQTEVTVGAYKRFAQQTAGRGMPPEPSFSKPLNSGWSDNSMPIAHCRRHVG